MVTPLALDPLFYRHPRYVDRKQCGRCGLMVPRHEFSARSASPDGLAGYCSPCNVSYQRSRKLQLKGEKMATVTEREYQRLRVRINYLENADERRRKAREASKRKHRDPAHREKLREKWRAQSLCPIRQSKKRAKRLLRMADSFVENVDIRVIHARTGRCYLCEKALSLADATLDHKVPLSRGGDHSYENCDVACGVCNSRKGAMTPEEYLKRYPPVFRPPLF